MALTTCTGVITKVLPKTDKQILGFNVTVTKAKTVSAKTSPKKK